MDWFVLDDFLLSLFLGQPVWLWLSFLSIVFILLFIDLGLMNRKDHVIGFRESLRLSAFYIVFGLLFGLWVWYRDGSDDAFDYYTVYVLEKSLSLDNLFVMSVIFASFRIPREYQHRVLVWGIIGVIMLRGVMIGLGAALVQSYDWVLFIFAAILIYTGYKMMVIDTDDGEDYTQKPYVKWMAKHLRITDHLEGHKFFTLTNHVDSGRVMLHATPLFLALLTIELTDVMFAFDSVPAALAVSTNTYIVYTANIFAILGLRALFFAMEHVLHRFAYLKYALALILIFIGGKVFWNQFIGHIPPAVSLSITLGVLAIGLLVSMRKTRGANQQNH